MKPLAIRLGHQETLAKSLVTVRERPHRASIEPFQLYGKLPEVRAMQKM